MDEPLYDAGFMAEHLGVTSAEHLGSTPRHGTWRVRRGDGELILKAFPGEHEVRFQRELAVLYHVRHRHLMALDRWGKVATPVGDVYWYTARYVPGGDVADAIHEGRWPDGGESVAFVASLGGVLAELHRHGIVHCDVKPGNIALRHGDWADPVLLDPGLVRFVDTDPPDGAPVGTTPYMSPEQLRGEPASPASDVFGLGVTVYRLTARGAHPFTERGERIDYAEAERRMATGPLRPLGGELGALVESMLTHAPEARPTASQVTAWAGAPSAGAAKS